MAAVPPDVPASYFIAGDINGNGQANGIDVTFGVSYFKGGAVPPHQFDCTGASGLYAEGDANGNCQFNGIDVTYLVSYFKGVGGPPTICAGCFRDSVQVTDADILPGQTVTWDSDKNYILNGFVFVDSGATLTIEPGCVIKGHPGQAENASALLVARDGRIIADGTVAAPIIFTASSDWTDDLNSIPVDLKGGWGGLLVLGRATINLTGGEKNIEGIPTTEPRGYYGGSDDDDDSGIIRYVSIRHGGSIIGANNEINGLTMGAVGRGTTIEFVEVFANLDDGFEWFGGTVNCRNLVSVFNDDDCFDYDEGWRGRGQFFFSLQHPTIGNRGAEQDGGIAPEDALPYSDPYIANVTYIGSGFSSSNADNDVAMIFRDYAMGHYWGGIYTEFARRGMTIDADSHGNLAADSIELDYTVWSRFGYASLGQPESLWTVQVVRDYMLDPAQNTTIEPDPVLTSVSWIGDGNLDPRPVGLPDIPAPYPSDSWFSPVTYFGAFDPNPAAPLWTNSWTYVSRLGFTQ
jgi:hypothetical protein